MYTAAIMKTELEASKGTRKLDVRIDNIQQVNDFTREIYPASSGYGGGDFVRLPGAGSIFQGTV